MKLYTEEQVKKLLDKMDVVYSLDKLTPIELPSDEEIEKELLFGDMIEGAKWMKKQILNQNNRVSTQDPAICEYSGLRPVEGYKEEIELEEGVEMFKIGGETDEERAYRRGYMDGYDEGVYDGENK